MTSSSSPVAAWEAFAAAIAARDADAARRSSTDGAWRSHGDSARTVYETAAEEGFQLSASGSAWIEADRAVLPVAIEARGRSSTLHALLEQRDGSWTVSAGVRDERHASLFLAGELPAVLEVKDLGPSPEGEQWARARAEELRASSAGLQVDVLGIHALPPRSRAVVGLRKVEGGGRPAQEWVCLDTSGGAPRELGRGGYPSLGLLLTGVQAELPARAAPASGAEDASPDADAGKIVGAFLQGLAEIARSTPPPADQTGRLPQALTESLARAFEAAGRQREAAALRHSAAAPPAGDAAQPTEPGAQARDALAPVREALQRELEAFRKQKGLETDEAVLGASFLAEHGQELAGRLLRVLANALPQLQPMVQAASASGPDRSS